MAVSTVVFLGVVLLCGVRDVHAGARLRSLTQQVRQLAREVNTWKLRAVNSETKMANNLKSLESSLKQEVTETFVPNLIKRLVKQAITDILEEEYTGNSIPGHVPDEIDRLKAVQNTNTQQFRDNVRERDTYRDNLGKLRFQLPKQIHTLQLQLNQTADDLREARLLSASLRKDFITLNTSCWMIRKDIEDHTHDEQGSKEGVQHMQGKLRIEIQQNQTIEDVQDLKQKVTGLKKDLMTLNTSCISREENKQTCVTEEPEKTSSLSQLSLTTLSSAYPTASNDPSQNDPSQNVSQSKMVPPVPGTTEAIDLNGTRSLADHDLYNASSDGDLEAVKRILSVGLANVNCRMGGRTPVMAAAWKGHKDVVEHLVGEGANVSLVDDDRNNILHYACRGGDMETVKLVLSLDAVGINSKGYKTGTPLMVAAQYGHREVVELLLRNGADASYVDFVGDNILIWACEGGDVETVELFLSLKVADINSHGWQRRTPVIEAAKHGHSDVVELLVKEGADVTQVDDIGENTLHWACQGGDLVTVKLVLSLNMVDINSKGWRSRTPVMVAARYGHRNVVEFLVTKKAKVSLVDDVNNNILHYACQGGDMETVKLVLSLNAVDINSRGQNKATPVIEAARSRHRDVVELLVTEGADVSLVDDSRTNILHWACHTGDLETVKLVLSLHVADINARSDYGQTALGIARFWGHPQVVDLLVSRGAQ